VGGSIPEELGPALLPLLETIALLSIQIADIDRRIELLIRDRYPEAKVLQQVPGVGPLISLTFILTIADPHRFQNSRQVGPYLGLVPRQRESGDCSPQLGISKAGNRYLRQLLVNGSQYHLGLARSRHGSSTVGTAASWDRKPERQEAGGGCRRS
jgi:transposase